MDWHGTTLANGTEIVVKFECKISKMHGGKYSYCASVSRASAMRGTKNQNPVLFPLDIGIPKARLAHFVFVFVCKFDEFKRGYHVKITTREPLLCSQARLLSHNDG
jgi:hypothetical protein